VLFKDEANSGKATVMKLGANDTQWSLVGSEGFSSGKINTPSLLVDGDVLYAAFGVVDKNNFASVQVMKYELNGEEGWTQAANPISVGLTDPYYFVDQDSYPYLLKHDGFIHLAYRNGTEIGEMTVKKLNASGEWETVGEADFSEGDIYDSSLAVLDGELYAGFTDYVFDVDYGATVMKFNAESGNWEVVGKRGFTNGGAFDTSFVSDGDRLYVIYEAESLDHMAVAMYFDPAQGKWVPAGGGDGIFSSGQAYDIAAAAEEGGLYAVYSDAAKNDRMTVMKFMGSGWTAVGSAGFTSGKAYEPSMIVIDGIPYVVYQDASNGSKLSVMKYGPFNLAPKASNVKIDGTLRAGQTVTGKYTYSDAENDIEGQSKYQWYVADNKQGSNKKAISGATGSSLQLTLEHVGKYLIFEVTPVAEQGTLEGSAVASSPAGPVDYPAPPAAPNVSADDVLNVIVGADATMEYSTDGGATYTPYNPSSPPIFAGNVTVKVRVAAVEATGTPAGADTTLTFTVNQSTISPATATFDKYAESAGYADVTATMTLNGNTLSSIVNGTAPLVVGTDYAAVGTTLTIKKEYLEKLEVGTVILTFIFSAGEPQTLTITISDSTQAPEPEPESSAIDPTTADFDKYAESEDYADITVTMDLKGNLFESIWNGGELLEKGTDYTENGNTITILKEYLKEQEAGTVTLKFVFSAGDPQTLTITISDSTPIAAEAPVLQIAEAGNAQVALTWSPVIGATGFKVFSSTASNSYEAEPATVTGSVYSYTVTGLTNGTTYYFVVKAVKGDIDSDASNELSAIPFTVPAAPTNVTAIAGNGQATVTFTAPGDNGGRSITGYEVTATPGGKVVTGTSSPIVITGLSNGTSYTFTVRAINIAGSSEPSAPSNAVIPSAPSSDEDDAPTQPAPPSEPETIAPANPEQTGDNGVTVLVNGKEEKAGTATTSTRNNQTVTTIAIDPDKLEEMLAEEGQGAVVTIPVPSGTDVAVGELNGQMVKNMEDQQAVLEIKTDRATYTLPARQINISAISGQVGAAVALEDIKVQVEIGEPAAETVRLAENAEADGTFAIVVPPVEFTVRATYGETTIEVTKFDIYVERTIAIPDGVDPDKITTGVVVEPDGTVRHVPTRIIVADGKYYAVINSLTNSTYTVVWNPREFGDVVSHWAKDTVNNMGSRMIIEGTGNGLFSPDRAISRAEFAAIVVRALGLGLEKGTSVFADVKESDWFGSAVRTAYAYGLLGGFDDGTFRPGDKITREQAMVIISRAMALTGLKAKLQELPADAALRTFADAAQVSGWAVSSIADCVQAGIVSGRNGNTLAPQDTITRAEAASMIERLLQKSDLI
jgi:hypothetical protein